MYIKQNLVHPLTKFLNLTCKNNLKQRSLPLKIDKSNTEKLIELTKKYGWLSDEKTGCSNLNIWILFRHSQKKYFEQIKKLIEHELNSNRLNNWEYKLIKNHLNGRPKEFD
jgi:hypothetical protein